MCRLCAQTIICSLYTSTEISPFFYMMASEARQSSSWGDTVVQLPLSVCISHVPPMWVSPGYIRDVLAALLGCAPSLVLSMIQQIRKWMAWIITLSPPFFTKDAAHKVIRQAVFRNSRMFLLFCWEGTLNILLFQAFTRWDKVDIK